MEKYIFDSYSQCSMMYNCVMCITAHPKHFKSCWTRSATQHMCIILFTLMTHTHSFKQGSLYWTTAQRSHIDKCSQTTRRQEEESLKIMISMPGFLFVFWDTDMYVYEWLISSFMNCFSMKKYKFVRTGFNSRASHHKQLLRMRSSPPLNWSTEHMNSSVAIWAIRTLLTVKHKQPILCLGTPFCSSNSDACNLG